MIWKKGSKGQNVEIEGLWRIDVPLSPYSGRGQKPEIQGVMPLRKDKGKKIRGEGKGALSPATVGDPRTAIKCREPFWDRAGKREKSCAQREKGGPGTGLDNRRVTRKGGGTTLQQEKQCQPLSADGNKNRG